MTITVASAALPVDDRRPGVRFQHRDEVPVVVLAFGEPLVVNEAPVVDQDCLLEVRKAREGGL